MLPTQTLRGPQLEKSIPACHGPAGRSRRKTRQYASEATLRMLSEKDVVAIFSVLHARTPGRHVKHPAWR